MFIRCNHWTLFIICNLEQDNTTIYNIDSCGIEQQEAMIVVTDLFTQMNKTVTAVFYKNCTLQDNAYDCGVYLLQYVEEFLYHNNISNFYFDKSKIAQKRKQLAVLISVYM